MKLIHIKNFRLIKSSSVLLFSTILLVTLLQSGCVNSYQPNASIPSSQSELKEIQSLGVEVVALRQTSGGFMLDFRYRVLNPDKAMSMFDEEVIPYLIDQESGRMLSVIGSTKVGPLRPTSRNPKKGVEYFMFFGNPSQLVKAGTKVTIVVGEQRIENITVQ